MKRREITQFNQAFGYATPLRPTTNANYKLRGKLIIEELEEYREACKNQDIVEIADAIGDMLYLVLGAAVEHGIEIEPVFDEIQRSNMSKLDSDGKPIYREDGKVLKGENYFKPNIKEALKESMLFEGYRQDDKIHVEVSDFVHTLVDVVANYFDITVNTLASRTRKQPVPLARQIISYLCFKKYKSYNYFENHLKAIIDRDRTTFIYSNNLIKECLEVDYNLQETIDSIELNLNKELKTLKF